MAVSKRLWFLFLLMCYLLFKDDCKKQRRVVFLRGTLDILVYLDHRANLDLKAAKVTVASQVLPGPQEQRASQVILGGQVNQDTQGCLASKDTRDREETQVKEEGRE